MMKKLSDDHYIIMNDSEIKQGDWVYQQNFEKTNNQIISIKTEFQSNVANDKNGSYTKRKITHSTQPESLGMGWMQSVQPLFLSEVKELLGVVDVEKKAFELAILFHNTYEKLAPAFGYETRLDTKVFDKYSANGKLMIAVCKEIYQALEDNKEKKYTEEDLADAINMARNEPDMSGNAIIQSLQPKTEWEVEFVDGKLQLVKE